MVFSVIHLSLIGSNMVVLIVTGRVYIIPVQLHTGVRVFCEALSNVHSVPQIILKYYWVQYPGLWTWPQLLVSACAP